MKIKTLTLILFSFVATSCWSPTDEPRVNSRPAASPSGGLSPSTNATATRTTNVAVNASSNAAPTKPMKLNLPSDFKMPTDAVGLRMLREYGAMFVAKGVKPPPKVVFADESEVRAFQSSVSSSTESIGVINVTLQTGALNALKAAIDDAKSKGLTITPRNADSSTRSYTQTVDNWASRVKPGLDYWVKKGRIEKSEADRISALTPSAQVPEIFKLEEQGIYFAKDFDKSIIYSVAPPGTSQHISMLALDVAEFDNARVREVLASHGWFQTVTSDLPHFTYLGAKASELPSLGLKKVEKDGREFWVPED